MSGNNESMIDRVAKAIYAIDGEPGLTWEDSRAVARAAIEAMREPPNMHEGWGDGLNADYRLIWEAMIDEALTPSPEITHERE